MMKRDALMRKVGVHGMKKSTLLGDKNIIRNTMEYIEKTGRFKRTLIINGGHSKKGPIRGRKSNTFVRSS